MPGGIRGPFTTWYPSGTVASHGGYLDFGARSVPDGVWGFWYPSGQRRTLGTYRRGMPVGCFAVWDEDGTRRTGFVAGDELREAPCTPPSDDVLVAVEGGAAEPMTPAWADVSMQAFLGAGGIGARSEGQVDPDPSLGAALGVTARKRFGSIRVGPTAGARISGSPDYRSFAAGGVLAFALPRLHPRVDAEVAAELGVQYLDVIAARTMQRGTAELGFWAPLGAVQLGVGLAMSSSVELLVAARVDGAPPRDVERTVIYCDLGCLAPQQESWRIGGVAYGVSFGVRLLIR